MRQIVITLLLAIGLTAGFVYGHDNSWWGSQMGPGMMGGGHGHHLMGPGMMGRGYGGYGNCPHSGWFGQNYQSNEGYQKFMEDTVDIRKELNNKQFEYREAQRNPNTTRKQLSSIENEILDLQKQLQEKYQEYR